MKKKIVLWKAKITGKEGHGRPLEADPADAWIKWENKAYPNIIHIAVDADINTALERAVEEAPEQSKL